MKYCVFHRLAVWLVLACAALAQEVGPVTEDFEKMKPGPPPDTLMVIEGEWSVVEESGNRLLELRAEPVVDAAILVGPSMKGAAAVRAKIRAGQSRRAFPRMGVGLYGVSGVKLRLVPAQKKIELLEGEDIIAEAPFDSWTENAWWHVELKVVATGDTWTAEARVWPESSHAPAAATLGKPLPSPPGQGRASVLGSPYANKAIHFDNVTVESGGKR